MGKVIRLVTQGDTWWYSHYGLVLSLFYARKCLEAYKASVLDTDAILESATARLVLDTIGCSTFWTK